MVVTLCGSTKFKEEFENVAKDLTLQGHIVLSPCIFHHADEIELTEEQKIQLDNLHKQKIILSDAVFVINKDDYIGSSTFGEIDWAYRLNKQVYYLEGHEDLNPDGSRREVPETENDIATPEIVDNEK